MCIHYAKCVCCVFSNSNPTAAICTNISSCGVIQLKWINSSIVQPWTYYSKSMVQHVNKVIGYIVLTLSGYLNLHSWYFLKLKWQIVNYLINYYRSQYQQPPRDIKLLFVAGVRSIVIALSLPVQVWDIWDIKYNFS